MLMCVAGIMFLYGKSYVMSHPHVFIETSVEFIFSESELKGFNLKWVFDEMFSSDVMGDCDKNNDGVLDKKEIIVAEENCFSNLKNYNYFCHIVHDGKKYMVKEVKEFNAYFNEDKKIVYEFFVPIKITLDKQYKNLKLAVYDDTYYIATGLSKVNPVQVKGISKKNYNYKCIQNNKDTFYYGQLIPTQIVLRFKK